MVELIKLKVKQASSVGENASIIKKSFISACKHLDASIFEVYIDEDTFFEDLDKYRFLQEMKQQFDYLRSVGIKEVKLGFGKCQMCNKGHRTNEFYTKLNTGKPAFAYIIQEENGEIKDIFRCNGSTGYSRAVEENRNPNLTFIKYD